MLSILSGKFKGHQLAVPKSGTRPTSSLVRKALFDSIRADVGEAVFCDLFAGSGAVGLEALSQGASKVFLIEANKQAFLCVKANVEKLKCQSVCSIFMKKARQFLDVSKSELGMIDFFFLDPPYDIDPDDTSSYESLLEYFNTAPLKQGCVIIVETKDRVRIEKPLETLEALRLISKKSYGDSLLYFIQKI